MTPGRHILRSALPALALVGLALTASATQSQLPEGIRNAQLTVTSAAGGLETALRSALEAGDGLGWVGYEVPMVAGTHEVCCFRHDHDGDSCCGTCWLEDHDGYSIGRQDRSEGRLESNRTLRVLMRLQGGRIDALRMVSGACSVDVGGLPLRWFAGVRSADSVGLLAGLADGTGELAARIDDDERPYQPAVGALALHADTQAALVLQRWAQRGPGIGLRRAAIFWLGSSRGAESMELLRTLAEGDSESEVREQAVFALSISDEPEAVDILIRIARDDPEPDVRGHALFWLAQAAGERAAAMISNAVEYDPDADVKAQAVFALSQLPPDRGVPLLIRIARTNSSAEVRKRAVFWLGQTEDERALDFIEELLRG